MMRLSCFLMLSKASRRRRTASRSSWLISAAWFIVSFMRFSFSKGEFGERGRVRALRRTSGCERAPARRIRSLALVNRQSRVVQLQDGQIHRRDEVGPDHAAGPAAVAGLRANHAGEVLFFVARPGQALAGLGVGEKPSITVFTEYVDRLCVIIVGILIVSHASTAETLQVLLAEFEPFFDERRIVIAETEATGDGRRRQRGPAAAGRHAATQTVDHAAAAVGRIAEVFLGILM